MAKKVVLATLDELIKKDEKDGKTRPLISIASTESQEEALSLLDKSNILALPVSSSGGYVGIVNRIDLLTPIFFLVLKAGETAPTDVKSAGWPKLEEPVANLLKVSKESLAESGGAVKFVYKDTDVLPQLLEAFSQGVHRVLVQHGDSHHVISQSDVVAYFNTNLSGLGALKDKPVSEFLSAGKLVTLDSKLTAFTAFRELLINGVQGAPVLNDGKLVASFSLSDSRWLNKGTFNDLNLPVMSYLEKHSTITTPTVEKKATLGDAIAKVTADNLHRVWVVEDNKVVGAVSLTDICTTIFTDKHVQNHYGEHQRIMATSASVLNTPLHEVMGKDRKEAITIAATATQKEAIELLAKNKILSVPVLKGTSGVGIVSLFDLLGGFLLDEKLSAKNLEGSDEDKKKNFLAAWEEAAKSPVSSAIGLSPESFLLLSYSQHERLHKVLDSFSQGHHRVIVKFGDKSRFLSQSDVVAFLGQNLSKLGDIAKTPASSLRPMDGKVKSVSHTQTALSCFRELIISSVLGAPVLSDDGKIIGNISISDLRGIGSDNLTDLLLPVCDYIKKYGGSKLYTVAKTETLEGIISHVVKNHLHRVWVVDGDNKPVGVITLTDIISVVLLDSIHKETAL